MKMKRKRLPTISLAAVLALVVIPLLVGNVFGGGAAEPEEEQYHILFNGPMPEEHNLTKAARMFAEIVEERTGGQVTVRVVPDAALGGGREALEAVRSGTQTMVDAALAPITAYEPAFGVLNLPYLFTSREQWYGLLDGPLGTDLLERLEDHGFVGLGYPENGIRHVTNSVRPIETVEDMEGINIRVMENPVFIEMFRRLGASPTPIPWAELYSALQQGVVGAQENPVVNIHGARLYEVQDYLSLTGHTYDANIYFVNKDFYDRLPTEFQDVLRQAATEAIAWQRQQAQQDEQELLAEIEPYIEINEIDEEELARFQEMLVPMYEAMKDEIGADVVEAWLKAVEDY